MGLLLHLGVWIQMQITNKKLNLMLFPICSCRYLREKEECLNGRSKRWPKDDGNSSIALAIAFILCFLSKTQNMGRRNANFRLGKVIEMKNHHDVPVRKEEWNWMTIGINQRTQNNIPEMGRAIPRGPTQALLSDHGAKHINYSPGKSRVIQTC